MKHPSQNARILELLAGGQWVDHHRLYEIGCVAHSRIAELRSRGYDIKQRRVTVNGKPIWEYRLAGLAQTTNEEIAESAPAPQTFPYLGADTTEQLTLDAA